MKSLLRSFAACLCILLAPLAARAQNYSDIWWNPAESGWGLTIADHQSNLFAVWFTYRQDGKPTWYVIPGGTFTNNRQHFAGDIYATTGPAYSAAFDPNRVTVSKVGTATIDFSASGATFGYSLAGVTQSKPIQRQPFGNSAPAWGKDVTDIWYNPGESGWGLTLAQHGNDVFGVWFTYDTDGQPMWVVMPGVTFNGTSAFTGTLYTTTGPYFATVPFDPSRVVVSAPQGSTSVTLGSGSANAQCAGTQSATLGTTFRGNTSQKPACRQPFGDAPPAANIDFPRAPGLLEGAALFAAPPKPVNVTIATDPLSTVTALVPASGGTIALTDAKGTRFTLSFPPGALMMDTAITMTSIATLSGVTYASGVVAGVKLEPDGLELQDNATLTVVPATPIPVSAQTPFTASGTGTDFRTAPAGRDAAMTISVPHFSLWGWLFMTSDERTNAMRTALATQNEARLMDWAAKYLKAVRDQALLGALPDNVPPPSIDQMQEWFTAYHDLVIKPLLQAAPQGCENALQALTKLSYYKSLYTASLGGIPPNFLEEFQALKEMFGAFDKPCYYEQHSELNSPTRQGFEHTYMNGRWMVSEHSGDVYTYKLVGGTAFVDYPDKPHCTISTKSVVLDPAKGKLVIDFSTKKYRGQGLQDIPITITCPGPPASSATVSFPMTYLGLVGESTGTLNSLLNVIDQQETAGNVTLKYRLVRCGEYTQFFCGQ